MAKGTFFYFFSRTHLSWFYTETPDVNIKKTTEKTELLKEQERDTRRPHRASETIEHHFVVSIHSSI